MNISAISLSLIKKAEGMLGRHIKKNNFIGSRKPHQPVFKVKQPIEIVLSLLPLKLTSLMDSIGGRIAVGKGAKAAIITTEPCNAAS